MSVLKAAAQAPVPALFLSHGSPMFAVEPGHTGPALVDWVTQNAPATQLQGIVVMSPHWMTRGMSVMTTPQPETLHDFGGFPPALYELHYPAVGAPALAERVLELLAQAHLTAGADAQRPLDHGAWVPLLHMYPAATVPVIQVSLPAGVPPADIYAIGQALAPLRSHGVLLMGSGGMTHNLRELQREAAPASPVPTAPHVWAFCDWVQAALTRQDLPALLDYRARAPHAVRVHPTDEHFLPIYFALGAGGWGQPNGPAPRFISREVMYGALSMAAFDLA